MTGALAVWDLSIDDVGVVSCHGTSTTLNDKNESGWLFGWEEEDEDPLKIDFSP